MFVLCCTLLPWWCGSFRFSRAGAHQPGRPRDRCHPAVPRRVLQLRAPDCGLGPPGPRAAVAQRPQAPADGRQGMGRRARGGRGSVGRRAAQPCRALYRGEENGGWRRAAGGDPDHRRAAQPCRALHRGEEARSAGPVLRRHCPARRPAEQHAASGRRLLGAG